MKHSENMKMSAKEIEELNEVALNFLTIFLLT